MTNNATPIAIFDFDGTMIKGDSIVPYLVYAYQKGKLSLSDILGMLPSALLGVAGLISPEKGKTAALRFLRGMSREEQQAFNTDFLQQRILPKIFPLASKRLLYHRAQNHIILLVSASSDCYMKHLKDFLPVHDVLASPTSPEGVVTRNCKGEEKVRRVWQWVEENGLNIDWALSSAYGDNKSDAPVMALTGNPLCVNPKKALSKAHPEWPKENWEEG